MLEKEFLEDRKTIDTNILVEFVSDVLYNRISPYKMSQETSEIFDTNGVRIYNTKSIDNFFKQKLYLEQELVLLFH